MTIYTKNLPTIGFETLFCIVAEPAFYFTIEAKAETQKPTIIMCKTIIGLGSPNKQGKEDCHGAPLGIGIMTIYTKNLPTIGFETLFCIVAEPAFYFTIN
jgi:hypothetical protein